MIAVVFPGQGSQKPGMGADFFDAAPAKAILEQIHEAIGVDVRKLTNLDEDALRHTENAQMALYACGVVAHACLGILPDAMAGHSIGEYAALAASKTISVADGAHLVKRRGELMATARPGSMAAVLGLERSDLERVCSSVSPGIVVVANDNCPGQLVISGDSNTVQMAGQKAVEAGAKRVLPLNVSGAFHSPLMEDSARAMRESLDQATFNDSGINVYSNVTARAVENPADWPQLLEDQLRSPVRWTECVQNMIAAGITTFIECGGGEVLSGLIKRIDKKVTTVAVGDTASLEKASEALRATTA